MITSFRVKGIDKVIRKTSNRISKLKNKRPVFLAAATKYRAWIGKNFDAEGGDHDRKSLKWKPLKESTIKRRRKGGKSKSDKILQDTGRLKGNWQVSATNNRGKVKSGVDYSVYHEEGAKKRNLPRRKIFPTEKQAWNDIILPVFNWFLKQLAK